MDEITRKKVFKYVETFFPSPGKAVFPASIDTLLDQFAQQEVAPEYLTEPEVATALRPCLEEILQDPLESSPPDWNRNKYLTYLLTHAPLHFHKIPYMLKDVLKQHVLNAPEAIRVLDVGAGPGISALSLLFFFELMANAYDICDVIGDEQRVFLLLNPLDKNKEALEIYQKVVYSYVPRVPSFGFELGARLNLEINEETRVTDLLGQEQYDIIVFSHVLSELKGMSLDKKAQIVADFAKHLTDSGTLLFLESPPHGGIAVSNQLKSRVVAKGLDLYGPCAHIMGPPTGPICLTCSLSQRESIKGAGRTEKLLKHLEGPSLADLEAQNRWVWAAFRKDGTWHHPGIDAADASALKDLVAKKDSGNARATVMVQIARREDKPFLFYKVCDQSTRIEECFLTFESPALQRNLPVGEVLKLTDVAVDYGRREGGENLKNKLYLVIDGKTQVENVTRADRSIPTSSLL